MANDKSIRAMTIGHAMEIALRELARLQLGASHRPSALYAHGDRQAEGAAFAVIFRSLKRSQRSEKFKLLIHDDGRTTVQPSQFCTLRTKPIWV